ncbi:hypothetical protein FACS189462_6040 [Spirochaetia bacterium]|nr:hypothetical protein FACS189462_6040 [Spirochaetia bacterium]
MKKINATLGVCLVFLVLSCQTLRAAPEPEKIRICSFNIQIFGAAKMLKSEVVEILLDIVSQADLVAIQEVRSASPEETYGPFFEIMIKKASDAQYQGAVKEAGFWVRQFPPADEAETDEESEEQEIYDFLILIIIDKNQLESQINTIFNAAQKDIKLKRYQAAAINRIGEKFFEGF